MDNSKKPKFNFNFFDIMIIIALTLAVLSTVYLTIMTEIDSTADATEGFKYTLMVEKINNDLAAHLNVGDEIFEFESGRSIGKITGLIFSDCYVKGEGTTSVMLYGYSTAQIQVECTGTAYEDESGIQKIIINGLDLRVGSDVEIRNTKVVFEANFVLPQKTEVGNEEA